MVGLIMIISLNRYYYTDKKYYGKLMIHGIIVICIVDLIWMICVLPKWTTSYVDNAYWEALKGRHTFGMIFSFIELLLKVTIEYLLIIDYKQTTQNLKELLSFKY